jgi:hypothetical protein
VNFQLDPTVRLRIMIIAVKLDIAHCMSKSESDCFFVARIVSSLILMILIILCLGLLFLCCGSLMMCSPTILLADYHL